MVSSVSCVVVATLEARGPAHLCSPQFLNHPPLMFSSRLMAGARRMSTTAAPRMASSTFKRNGFLLCGVMAVVAAGTAATGTEQARCDAVDPHKFGKEEAAEKVSKEWLDVFVVKNIMHNCPAHKPPCCAPAVPLLCNVCHPS